ncbi:MAG: hypothetical protein LBG19_10320 [Prevotellaceae bacterium]|nr:hypothetical protein [Prevotellaceae bacterium]
MVPEQIIPASNFQHSSSTSTSRIKPDNSQFQIIHIDEHCIPSSFESIWEPVSNLEKVRDYYNSNKKVGIFLYTSGVGYPDDQINKHKEDWRWFIVMYK